MIGVRNRAKRVCKMEGCNDIHWAKGLCQSHYMRRYHGKLLLPENSEIATPERPRWEYSGFEDELIAAQGE